MIQKLNLTHVITRMGYIGTIGSINGSVFSTSRFEPFVVRNRESETVVGLSVDPVTTIVKKGATKDSMQH